MFDCKRKLSDIFERNVEGIEVSVNCMKQEKKIQNFSLFLKKIVLYKESPLTSNKG